MLTFLEIQDKVDQISEKIGLDKKRVWPAVQNDGSPYLLIYENKYWYIAEERGEVIFKKTTKDLNELLYWIMDDFISSYSYEFELKNRTRGQDFRRIVFSKQIELVGLISDEWKVKKVNEIKKILEIAPYREKPIIIKKSKHQEPKKSGAKIVMVCVGLILIFYSIFFNF